MRAYVCVCVYELAQLKAARAFKDVAIYEPPPPLVRVRLYVRARIRFHDRNAAAAATSSAGSGGTTPPSHVLYRCRRAPRDLCTCAQGSWRWPGRRQGLAPVRLNRTVACARCRARNRRMAAVRPGLSPKGFSTHMGARVAQQVGFGAAPRSAANAQTVALKWERARFV